MAKFMAGKKNKSIRFNPLCLSVCLCVCVSLSVSQSWYYGSERLEVVNTYRCLELTFSTRLSFTVAIDGEHLTRAKRGTIEILKTLRRLNCFSPGLSFGLFDGQIVPSLLYGSVLWGFER